MLTPALPSGSRTDLGQVPPSLWASLPLFPSHVGLSLAHIFPQEWPPQGNPAPPETPQVSPSPAALLNLPAPPPHPGEEEQ